MAEILAAGPVVAVVEIEREDHARPLGEALRTGGIANVEVVLRTEAALGAAEQMAMLADLTVGLGSVVEADQLRFGVQIGAKFVATPGINDDLLKTSRVEKIACLPGVFTPSETMLALDFECTVVKFFPAMIGSANSVFSYVARSFPRLCYCLSGGINEANMATALALSRVIAVSGTWIAPRAAIAAGDWTGISARAAAAVSIARARPALATGASAVQLKGL